MGGHDSLVGSKEWWWCRRCWYIGNVRAVGLHNLARANFALCQLGHISIQHCGTKLMVADALTKLATSEVIQILVDAMEGRLPPV